MPSRGIRTRRRRPSGYPDSRADGPVGSTQRQGTPVTLSLTVNGVLK